MKPFPALTAFDLFLKRLGHFLWKGIKPFPAQTAFDLFF